MQAHSEGRRGGDEAFDRDRHRRARSRDSPAVAKTVICSSLVKAAVYGGDANWGRILCAIGYSPADIDVTKVEVSIRSAGGEVAVCRDGAGVPFSEEEAAKVLAAEEVEILIDLHDGRRVRRPGDVT